MDIAVYKLVHILGLILLFQSLGAYLFLSLSAEGTVDAPPARMLKIMHGVGLLFLLVGGFGMLAKMSIMWPMPVWVWIKIIAWILLGGAFIHVKKNVDMARFWWILVIVLGALAAYLGGFKPF